MPLEEGFLFLGFGDVIISSKMRGNIKEEAQKAEKKMKQLIINEKDKVRAGGDAWKDNQRVIEIPTTHLGHTHTYHLYPLRDDKQKEACCRSVMLMSSATA
jgi:ATP-dependent DNA ligase